MSSEHVTLHKENLKKVVDNKDTFLEGNLIEQIMDTDDLIKLKELMEGLQDELACKKMNQKLGTIINKKMLTYAKIDKDVLKSMEPPGKKWFMCIAVSLTALAMGMYALFIQVTGGLEISGISHPIGWGVYITDFVFWVGIAHAGTLISAVLFLTRAPYRTSIYRTAEAMTVFAVMTAGLFPIIHVGRIWNAYWLVPYPNQRELWVNFKSPLLWDVFAVSTYMSVSIAFFIVGLIPDFATVRDRAKGLMKFFYGFLALGFRGTNHQWVHYLRGYLLFAALATPLVFSVHSIVSWDFAMSSIPGWQHIFHPRPYSRSPVGSGAKKQATQNSNNNFFSSFHG